MLLVRYQSFVVRVLLALMSISFGMEQKVVKNLLLVTDFSDFLIGFFGFRYQATKTGWRKGGITVPGKISYSFQK